MKRYVVALMGLLFWGIDYPLFAQFSGNEWIDYSLTYYKISVSQEGIYKITKQTLANAGFPVSTVNPKNIQLFHNGKEQPIYIKGENDFIFDDTDYILFYGKSNDGWLDSALYDMPENQTNPYYSLFSDTAAYFLTWKTDTSTKKRFTLISDTAYSLYPIVPYCMVSEIHNYTDAYYFGSNLSGYGASEGWFDSQAFSNATVTKNIILNGLFDSGGDASFEICVAGVPNSDVYSSVWHELVIKINNV